MSSVEKMIDYLRNAEIDEVELRRVYERFFKKSEFEGFEKGCEFLRSMLSRQRASHAAIMRKNFKLLIEDIEDYLNTKG